MYVFLCYLLYFAYYNILFYILHSILLCKTLRKIQTNIYIRAIMGLYGYQIFTK